MSIKTFLMGVAAMFAAAAFAARDIEFPALHFHGDYGLDDAPIRFAYFPTANRIRVSHGAADELGRSGRFSILDSRGKTLFSREVRDEKEWTASVPDLKSATKASGDGSYTARFVEADGTVREIPFRRDVFDWEGNSLGKSDVVPEPFEPVKAEGNRVATVLREHTLTPLGLPAQINAAGEDILAMPFDLSCQKDGQVENVTGEGFRFVERKNQYATFTARVKSRNFRGRVDGSWWMDGMLDWTLTIESGAFDALYMTIRQKPGVAKLMHAVTDRVLWFHYAGKVPDGMGAVWSCDSERRDELPAGFVPYVWFGGTLRGISVFAENDFGWNANGWPAQQLIRNPDGSVELLLNIFRAQTVITRPRPIRLGFMATPVKPLPENWRAIKPDVLLGCCWHWGAQTPCNDLEPLDPTDVFYRALAEAKRTGRVDESLPQRTIANYRCSPTVDPVIASNRMQVVRDHFAIGLNLAKQAFEEKRPTCFYTNGRGLNFNLPPGRTFCNEWHRNNFVNRDAFDVDASAAYEIDPVPTYLDYAAACWKRMLASGACDHLYWDDVFLAANFNPETSAAFRDYRGLVHPASGIFNMRAQVMRGAVLQKEMGMDCRGNWVHCTNTDMAPISAFAGVNYDWEDVYQSTPIHERYSRAYIQASTIGRQFGVRTKVICYFGATYDIPDPALAEQAIGVMLTHELAWERVPRWNEIHDALMKWGYGASDTQVWNYWDEEGYPLSLAGAETSSIAMRRRDGEAVVIVSSWIKAASVVVLKPAAMLADGRCAAKDFLTGEAIAVKDGALSVPLAGYAWKAIRLVPAKGGL